MNISKWSRFFVFCSLILGITAGPAYSMRSPCEPSSLSCTPSKRELTGKLLLDADPSGNAKCHQNCHVSFSNPSPMPSCDKPLCIEKGPPVPKDCSTYDFDQDVQVYVADNTRSCSSIIVTQLATKCSQLTKAQAVVIQNCTFANQF